MITTADLACIELKQTYDANILKKYSTEIEETFKIVCKLSEKSNKKGLNKNLVKLVNNLDKYTPKPKKFMTKFITGPGKILRLKHSRLPQDIYLFGEKDHSNLYGCEGIHSVKIEDYFEHLFSSTTKFIDIYIEFQIELDKFSRTDCDVIAEDNTLCDIYKFFRRCITSDSTTCKYPIRLHPIDIRNERKNDIHNYYRMLIELWYIQDLDSLKLFIKTHQNFLDNIETINQKSQKYIINTILENKTIKKELERSSLSHKQINKAINSSQIWREIKNASYIMKPIYSKLKSDSKYIPYNFNISRDITDFTYYLRTISCLHMDIYTIARMFKKFNVTSDHHPPKPLNIIYYAGKQHTDFMTFMLQELGFQIKEKSIPIPHLTSCVNIQSLKQPLFS